MKISVCVITKNEERHLKKCLSSILSLAHEIILIDTGSNDNTLIVAEEFGCKIRTIKWINDFSYARNVAIDFASGDWIIFLDADEHLICKSDIQSVLKKIDPNIGGLIISRYDHFKNEITNKITTIPIGIVRIFRNNKLFRFKYPVHEIISESIIENGFDLKSSNEFIIFHRIHEHKKEFIQFKQESYLKIINQNLIDYRGTNFWLKYQEAKTLWYLGDIQNSKMGFLFIVQYCKISELKISSLNNLAVLSLENQDYHEAEKFLKESLKLNGKESQTLLIYSDVRIAKKNYLQALRLLLKVKTELTTSGTFIPGSLYLFDYQKYFRIALIFANIRFYNVSIYYLNKSLKLKNDYVDSLFLKSKVLKKQKRLEESKNLLNQIEKINPDWIVLNQMD